MCVRFCLFVPFNPLFNVSSFSLSPASMLFPYFLLCVCVFPNAGIFSVFFFPSYQKLNFSYVCIIEEYKMSSRVQQRFGTLVLRETGARHR